MIKNIIFDIGNVMVTYRPEEFILKLGAEKRFALSLAKKIFGSAQWADGDKFNKPISEMKNELNEIYPEHKELISNILDNCTDMFETVNHPEHTLSQLKNHGFSLYYLSNISEFVLNSLINKHEAFKYFDGGIASYAYNTVKPDERIYHILLEKYHLQADECLFIDDLEKNIDTAKALGFNTIHLKKAEYLRDELKKINELKTALV